jgi:hypothetical protein
LVNEDFITPLLKYVESIELPQHGHERCWPIKTNDLLPFSLDEDMAKELYKKLVESRPN